MTPCPWARTGARRGAMISGHAHCPACPRRPDARRRSRSWPPRPSASCRPTAACWPPASSSTSASRPPVTAARRPAGLRVWVDGQEWTARNDPRAQEGAATGSDQLPGAPVQHDEGRAPWSSGPRRPTAPRPSRACASRPGQARCGGASPAPATSSSSSATAWAPRTAPPRASCRAACTTARPRGRLAMDTLDVTGQVMTGSLNAVDHRLVAGHGRLRDRPEERQQPGGRVPRQHAGRLRQPAHRVPRRDPASHARARLQRRHRHHRRPDRLDAGRQRRAHLQPLRGPRHRRAVLRRARRPTA